MDRCQTCKRTLREGYLFCSLACKARPEPPCTAPCAPLYAAQPRMQAPRPAHARHAEKPRRRTAPLTLTLANRARLGARKLVDPAMTLRARLALPRGSAPCPIAAQVASLQLERGGSLARVAGGRPRAELPCAAAGQGCLSASALAFAR